MKIKDEIPDRSWMISLNTPFGWSKTMNRLDYCMHFVERSCTPWSPKLDGDVETFMSRVTFIPAHTVFLPFPRRQGHAWRASVSAPPILSSCSLNSCPLIFGTGLLRHKWLQVESINSGWHLYNKRQPTQCCGFEIRPMEAGNSYRDCPSGKFYNCQPLS